MAKHDDDTITNFTSDPHIDDLIRHRAANPARRRLLRGGIGLGTVSFVGGAAGLVGGCSSGAEEAGATLDAKRAPVPTAAVDPVRPSALGFVAVPKSRDDAVTVAAGYTATVLFRLGDPLDATTGTYANDGSDSAESFAFRAGDHHDGMFYLASARMASTVRR